MKFDSDLNNTREIPEIDIDSFRKVSEQLATLPGEPEEIASGTDLNKKRDIFSDEKVKPDPKDFYTKKPEPSGKAKPANSAFAGGFSLKEDTYKDDYPVITKPETDAVESNDDFIIGKGFQLEEPGENITLGSGGASRRSDNMRKTKSAPAKTDGRRRKKQKGGCLGAVVWVFVVLVVSIGLAVTAIFAVSDIFGIGKSGTSDVNIEQGSSTEVIAESLKESGAIRFPILFRLYSKIKHTDSSYQYGLYSINNEGGYDGIIDQLQKEGAKAETVEVRIPEMSTLKKIGEILEENGICTVSDFNSLVKSGSFDFDFIGDIPVEKVVFRFEGYLAPDTFQFYASDDSKAGAELAIRRMLGRTDEIWTQEYRQKAAEMGYSLHEIMTMASIIELEAGGASAEDKSKVAAVFYNRLKWNDAKLLGSSPTIGYAELYNNSNYDTYKTEGLPPGPLCAPSVNSIKAALYPTENFDYYYFVTDASGTFHYNRTLSEHTNTINRLQSSGNWLGDGDLAGMFD